MIRNLLAMVVGGALVAGIAGCTDPIAANQDPIQVYQQVTVDSYSLQNDIVVQTPIASRVGAGQLEVNIVVRNKTDDDLKLDYKYYFTDAKGIPIDRDTSWQAVTIPRKGAEGVKFTSLTASAADFRVEFRRRKH